MQPVWKRLKKRIPLILIFGQLTFFGCEKDEIRNTKVLIVGDSWGKLSCIFKSYDDAFNGIGKPSVRTDCQSTTENGSTSADWNEEKRLKRIYQALDRFPKISVVVLSMGGNDLFRYWNKDLSFEERRAVWDYVLYHTERVVSAIKRKRNGIKVVIVGYDYPNFEYLSSSKVEFYEDLYNRLGRPTPAELNEAFVELEGTKLQYSLRNDNVFYVSNLGIMQYVFHRGDSRYPFPGDLPTYSPFPGGNPSEVTPKEAMVGIDLFSFVDPFHLNKFGYIVIAQNVVRQALRHWL